MAELSEYKVSRTGKLTLYDTMTIDGAQSDDTLPELQLLIAMCGITDKTLTHFTLTGELMQREWNDNYKLN